MSTDRTATNEVVKLPDGRLVLQWGTRTGHGRPDAEVLAADRLADVGRSMHQKWRSHMAAWEASRPDPDPDPEPLLSRANESESFVEDLISETVDSLIAAGLDEASLEVDLALAGVVPLTDALIEAMYDMSNWNAVAAPAAV